MDSLTRDTESRNRIVSDIYTNFFVEAGAGSGKTTMLVNRMVAMVEAGIDIKKISAITFTKAAAGEFYERFQKILIDRSNPEYVWEDKGHAGQLPKPTDETRERCAKALQNIDLCFMGTIDSFCNMILSEHPSEAGILSDSTLVTDVDIFMILRQIYVKICQGDYGEEMKNLANTFRAVNSQDEDAFCRGMKLLIEHRNAHFNYNSSNVINIDEDFADVRKDLIKITQCLADHQELKYEGNKHSRTAWENIDDIHFALKRRWSRAFSSVKWALKNLKDLAVVPQAMDLYGPYLSGYFEDTAPKKKCLKCTIGEEGGIYTKIQNLQYDVSMTFLDKCVSIVEQYMHDAGYLTYFDYLYYLRNTLKKDAESDGKLIRYINDRHSYFLIDEFQDTNPMQAEVFFYLSSENPVGKWQDCRPRDGSLFIVGDPKQSIYRFRNADVTSFLNVKKLFVKHGGEILELSRNFRSKKCLCEYYNKIFSGLLPEETVNQSKFEEIPVPGVITDEFSGIYSYDVLPDDDKASWVADIVRSLVYNERFKIRGKEDKEPRLIRYSDVMIITYSKTNLPDIIEYFEKIRVPIKVEGEVLFDQCEALQELYKIYAVLADPDDRIALYGALTSRAIGLTREELLAFRSKGGEISLSSTFDVKNTKSEKVLKVAAKLEELKTIVSNSQNMSPAALLSSILDQFKIYTFAEARNLEIIYYTLELLRSAEKSGIVVTLKDGKAYLHELLSGESEIERCLSLNDEENSVHIANLHKVKGLEAPIIILDWAQAGGSSPNIRIDYKDDLTEAFLFALQRANREDGYCFSTEQFPDEKDQEKGALEAEELRKIYVAATRARNALFVCTYGGGKSRWKYLDPTSLTGISTFLSAKDVTTWEMGEKADPVELYREADKTCVFCNRSAEEPSFRMQNPSRLSVASKVSEDKELPGSEDAAETEKHPYAALMGTMVHKLMEILVTTRGKTDLNNTVEEIVNEYVSGRYRPYEDQIRENLIYVAETVTNGGYAQTNGLPQDILNTLIKADEVYCEVPFCYKEDSPEGVIIWNGIMDVVYCSGGKWHIIDYKTNAEGDDLDTKYQKQLEAYEKAFKETTGNDADAMTYHINI